MNYRDSILSYLQKIENTWNELTELDLKLLSDHIQIENVKKNKYLLNEGEICKYIYVVQSGSAWKFHVIKGKKVPTEFAFKEDILIPFQSYYLQTPSHEYIQVMEDSTIEKIEWLLYRDLELFKKVALKHIASYLDIRIETLIRERKKIFSL
jgi:signal-transduction protein with cAMP-binding, CBS, and nucleotidyltransferase domain